MTLTEFNDWLATHGGRNFHDQSLLRVVDARRETEWVAGTHRLKYLDHTEPDGTEVGQECYVVERWRSPEFLAATGRFTAHRFDDDGAEVIREMPSEGVYDYLLRIAPADLQNRSGEVLDTVRDVWAFQRLSHREQMERIAAHEERRARERKEREQQFWNGVWGFDPNDYHTLTNSAGHVQSVRRKKEI